MYIHLLLSEEMCVYNLVDPWTDWKRENKNADFIYECVSTIHLFFTFQIMLITCEKTNKNIVSLSNCFALLFIIMHAFLCSMLMVHPSYVRIQDKNTHITWSRFISWKFHAKQRPPRKVKTIESLSDFPCWHAACCHGGRGCVDKSGIVKGGTYFVSGQASLNACSRWRKFIA